MTNNEARALLSNGLEHEISQLRKLDPYKRFAELGVFLGMWAAGLALVRTGSVATPLGTMVVALALNAFVLLLHEGMHNTLFRNRHVNDLTSVLLGATVGISYTAYKVMHLRHHTFLGDHRDPDDYNNYTTSKRLVWVLHGMRVLCGSLMYLFLIPFSATRFANAEVRRRILLEYLFIGSVYGLLVWGVPWSALLRYHLWSLLIVGFMVNLRGFTQHGLAVPEDPYLASRSIHAHPVVAFLLLNENFHLEHHLFPEIPSYNLGRLHRLIWSRLPRAVKNDSYSEFLLASLKAAPRMDDSPIGVTQPESFRNFD